MSKYFPVEVESDLKNWLSPRSWKSKHHSDMKAFYQFLKALDRHSESKHNWSSDFADKLEGVMKEREPDLQHEKLKELVRFFSERAHIVYDYVKA